MSKKIATYPCALRACAGRSSVTRRLRLLSTTAALASALFLAPGAVGNECGAVVAGEVTCTSGGSYGSGISYDGSDVSGDLTMSFPAPWVLSPPELP
jgi:hypothetical protein